jgi:hypothetical protein
MSSTECITKRQLYISKPYPLIDIPVRTRIYHRSSSLPGFILETPCSLKNFNRYLIIYDDFAAYYHLQTDFHLCLCQDFQRHMSNIDYTDLRSHYQHAFHGPNTSNKSKTFTLGTIIRVRKFGSQFHNARIIDKDCSIIKICFFERKSQAEMWIHSNSSIIDQSQELPLPIKLRMSSQSSSSSSSISDNPIKDLVLSDSDLSRLRKRKTNVININEGISIVTKNKYRVRRAKL